MKTVQIRQALLAATFALVGAPALADTMPGTQCTSEGATKKSVTGLMVNIEPAAGTTYFHCPLPHARYNNATLTPLTIRVNYKTSNYQNLEAGVRFQCSVRTVMPSNFTVSTLTLSGSTTYFAGDYDTLEGQILLPLYGSANMRCNVPNDYSGGGQAGIVSYSVF